MQSTYGLSIECKGKIHKLYNIDRFAVCSTEHNSGQRKRLKSNRTQGWVRLSDTTGTSVAVSTVILFTGTPSTKPAMRTRRVEEDKESRWFCAPALSCATWSELYFLSGEPFSFLVPGRIQERRGAVPLLGHTRSRALALEDSYMDSAKVTRLRDKTFPDKHVLVLLGK